MQATNRNGLRRAKDRRGITIVLATFFSVIMLGFVAFSIDTGYICLVRSQAQNAADSAALAAGQELLDEDRLRGIFAPVHAEARSIAAQYAAYHQVGKGPGALQTADDVQIGRLDNPTDRNAALDYSNPKAYNAVTVNVRVSRTRGTQAPLFFARVWGQQDFETQTSATAAVGDRIGGFRPTNDHPVTSLLPFALKLTDWKAFLNSATEDEWTYDDEHKSIYPGPDGLPELKLYPIDSGAGNWGTVNIGTDNNSTSGIERQIRDGINQSDLAAYDGAIELNDLTQSFSLNGDTGMSAGMKVALEDIVGQPRTIPLYRTAEGTGNTMNYEIVGFAGIRIVEVKLTGTTKFVRIQPAYVIDATATYQSGSAESYFVTQPLRLVR